MKKQIALLFILTLCVFAGGCVARRTDPVAGGEPVAVSETAGTIRAADHTHTPAETPQTVSATPMGPTCGNTQTTIQPCTTADGALAQADLTEEQLQELQEIIDRQVN